MGIRNNKSKERGCSSRGVAFKYANYEDNHVVWPGSEAELEQFVRKGFGQMRMHKWDNAHSSNSEDALTWSCFDTLRRLPATSRRNVLKAFGHCASLIPKCLMA